MLAVRALPELASSAHARLYGFVSDLRSNGFIVGMAEVTDALDLLGGPAALFPAILRPAFRALFCTCQNDWKKFDALFDAAFLPRRGRSSTRVVSVPTKSTRGFSVSPGLRSSGAGDNASAVERDGGAEETEPGRSRREGASFAESLATRDFRTLTDPEELAQAHALAERLARSMKARLTRRMRARRSGVSLHFRRTIHRSVAQGGEPIHLVHRRRKDKPLRLVVILDASGSMSLYSSFFLRFMHGVVENFRESEAFLFHTRLIHISSALKERNAERAAERLALMAQGSGGGTRIGESLATFNRWHARRCLTSRSCIIIISDGYDTGSAEALGEEMKRLRQRCRRIIWLNPMIGWDGYAPEAAGMKAAMPHVDLFASAHTLDSLVALEPYLARI
ncbi:CoxE Protein containing von Willebrand factor type A (vWA) domain [Rhabdaerophilaceae bacterium]